MVLALVASWAVGMLRGGSASAVSRHPWRLMIVPVLALAVQVLAFLPDENASTAARTWAAGLHIASYLLILVFVWANRTTPWLWLIGIGLVANAVVIAANGGFMPILRDGPPSGSPPSVIVYNHLTLLRDDTRLPFLADIFRLPAWLPSRRVFSLGDLLMAGGAFCLVQHLMVQRPRRSGRDSDALWA